MSMWSDMYCYIDQCGSSTGATPPGAILFNPKHDLEFSQVLKLLRAFYGMTSCPHSVNRRHDLATWARCSCCILALQLLH